MPVVEYREFVRVCDWRVCELFVRLLLHTKRDRWSPVARGCCHSDCATRKLSSMNQSPCRHCVCMQCVLLELFVFSLRSVYSLCTLQNACRECCRVCGLSGCGKTARVHSVTLFILLSSAVSVVSLCCCVHLMLNPMQ